MQVLNYWEGSIVVQLALEPFVVSTFLEAVMPNNFNPLTGRPRPGSLAQSLRDMAKARLFSQENMHGALHCRSLIAWVCIIILKITEGANRASCCAMQVLWVEKVPEVQRAEEAAGLSIDSQAVVLRMCETAQNDSVSCLACMLPASRAISQLCTSYCSVMSGACR
jgi:hypothetical protein